MQAKSWPKTESLHEEKGLIKTRKQTSNRIMSNDVIVILFGPNAAQVTRSSVPEVCHS